MKLEFPNIKVEQSRAFESENFSLGDTRVIMELLSSKIYSRPKYIIVQEVSSNARDANREAGREDVPIQIKLPSRLDDNLIIADSGPGISPDRMSTVFLKYGESTKRADNVLTGGFGIGAKTPFTYTDTFNVVTVTDDEDGKRRERIYIAHKSSNGMAKMSLVSTKESTEDTGTAISFAVEKADFDDFMRATREVCRYWKVRPTVTGVPNWKWPEETPIHKGKGWALVERHQGAKILIDSIPYTLRLETVFGDDRKDEAYKVLTQGSVRMYFKTGEIEVSATREDLDYKDKTIKAIKDRANECLAELRAKVSKAVDKAPTLWDASIQWHNDSSSFRQFLVEPQWKSKNLFKESYGFGGSVYTSDLKFYKGKENYVSLIGHIKVTNFVKDNNGSIISKKSYGRTVDRYIHINKDTLIIVDDEGKERPNRLRLKTIFDKNPGIKVVTIVLFKTVFGKDYAKEVMMWDDVPTKLFTSFPKAKRPKGPNGKTRTINAVKTLEDSSARGGWSKQWQPCADLTPEDGDGNFYVIIKDGKPCLSSGKFIDKNSLVAIFKEVDPKSKVYGILWKYRNKVDKTTWTDVWTKAIERVAELKKKPDVATYIKYGHCDAHGGLGHSLSGFLSKNKNIKDPSISDFLEKAELASKAKADYNQYSRLATRVGTTPDSPGGEFAKMQKKIFDAYPILVKYQNMLRYAYGHDEKKQNQLIRDELIFYLNAKYEAAKAAQGVKKNANP
jgi:hypothetical protein